MSERLADIAAFLIQLDGLKSIDRRTYINGGERVENSAEHSWHLAIACWAFAKHLELDLDIEKLLKLALVHDLGEIDAGDTFLYGQARETAHIAEKKCVERIASHSGNSIVDLVDLWEEQEHGNSKEAKLLKVVDRLLPFFHNMTSQGQAWKDNGVTASQVRKVHDFIYDESPEIHGWFSERLDYAIEQGWLDAS